MSILFRAVFIASSSFQPFVAFISSSVICFADSFWSFVFSCAFFFSSIFCFASFSFWAILLCTSLSTGAFIRLPINSPSFTSGFASFSCLIRFSNSLLVGFSTPSFLNKPLASSSKVLCFFSVNVIVFLSEASLFTLSISSATTLYAAFASSAVCLPCKRLSSASSSPGTTTSSPAQPLIFPPFASRTFSFVVPNFFAKASTLSPFCKITFVLPFPSYSTVYSLPSTVFFWLILLFSLL